MTKTVPFLSGVDASLMQRLTVGGVWEHVRNQIVDSPIMGSASTAYRVLRKRANDLKLNQIIFLAERIGLPVDALQDDYVYVRLTDGRIAAARVEYISPAPMVPPLNGAKCADKEVYNG